MIVIFSSIDNLMDAIACWKNHTMEFQLPARWRGVAEAWLGHSGRQDLEDLLNEAGAAINQARIDLDQGRTQVQSAFGILRREDSPGAHDRQLAVQALDGSLQEVLAAGAERRAATGR